MKYIREITIDKDQLNLINKNVVIRKLNIRRIEDIYSIKDLILNNKIINLSYDFLKDHKNTLNQKEIKKLEDLISNDPEYSYLYANDVIKGPWERGEDTISKDSRYSYCYARDVIKGPFQQGEDIISKDTYYSYLYADNIIKGPWEKGEDAISRISRYSYDYSRFIIKRPWERGEDSISKHGFYSYFYALNVINGPWEKGENAISKNPYASYLYATNVIKGPFEKCHPMIFSSERQEIQEDDEYEHEEYKDKYKNFLKSINYDMNKIKPFLDKEL